MIRIIDVTRATSAHYGLPLSDMIRDGRTKELIRPRQVAHWLARRLTLRSLSVIGRVHRRDHSSVVHALKCVDRAMDQDPALRADAEAIAARLGMTLDGAPLRAGDGGRRRTIAAALAAALELSDPGPDQTPQDEARAYRRLRHATAALAAFYPTRKEDDHVHH
jgi:hypothetical protein